MTSKLTVLGCQIDIPLMSTDSERDAHVERVAQCVDECLKQKPAELVVLPELSSIDYSHDAFEQLNALAEPPEGSSFSVWREVARRHSCYVVYGYAQSLKPGYTIATAIVNPAGELAAVYHKLHLAQFGDSMEKEYFTAGDRNLVLVDICGFRLSPIICYDIRAPELCRTLAVDHGVDCILHTGAYARDPSFYSWHAFATTRAVENQLYFLSLNRAGQHFGHSVFCPPWVDQHHQPVTFEEYAEEFRYLTLDRGALQQARNEFTFLQDRLDSYQLPVVGG
jgi:nitrilase